ncbi:MAG: ABC transporter permease subunit [Planctomycetia bacterium]|nr:ABC transporter permease subunit [Planctomycetia bacterium]
MGIDAAHYHAWNGKLRSPWRATAAVVRTTLLQAIRRKAYWFIYAVGVSQFLVYWAVIYALTQMQIPPQAQQGMLDTFGFSTEAEDPQNTGYLDFMEQQSMVVMILLAFCGSTIIGGDFRDGALPFYLSRRIDRRHYIAGKILATAALVWLLTVVPALLLFLEYGLFTTSLDYWSEHWRVVPAVLGYGAVLGLVLAIWLVALSAYLQRLAPIAVTWSSLFVLLGRLALMLRDASGDRHWLLLDPWRDIRLAGRLFFGIFRYRSDADLSLWAAALLVATSLVALAALVRRVRAVEVAT